MNKNNTYLRKNIQLSDEFERYIRNHQEVFKGKPKNPCFIVIDASDKKFTERKLSFIKGSRKCFIAEKKRANWEISALSAFAK